MTLAVDKMEMGLNKQEEILDLIAVRIAIYFFLPFF